MKKYPSILLHNWDRTQMFWFSKLDIWPWKFKVKVMAMVKIYGHI